MEAAFPVLMTLGLGCLISSSLFVNESFLGASGHQRARALFASIEGILGITMSILLGLRMGMLGVAAGYMIAVIMVRGLVCSRYVCHLLEIRLVGYYAQCLLRPWLITGMTAAIIYYSGIPSYVHNWPSLILFGILVGCVYTATIFIVVMDPEEKLKIVGIMRKLFTRASFAADSKN